MKPLLKTSAFLLLWLLASYSAFTQNIAKTDTGTVNCAAYKILIPENWQNKLVMFAHGYEFMGSPSGIQQPGFLQTARIFLERGFAVAASAYAYQGFALARQFNLKVEDIPFSIFFGEAVLRDVAVKSGGNPFDNTNTIYSGFSGDWEINQKVVRLRATANPDLIFEKYDRTGDIGKPVVLMHTIYDQLISPRYGEVNFENMVHKQGKDHFLTVMMCNRQGHCNFTPEQIGKSFDELRRWVHTGEKARPEMLK